jgi:hypothetical protein
MSAQKKKSAWSLAAEAMNRPQQKGEMEEPQSGNTSELQDKKAVEPESEISALQQEGEMEKLQNGKIVKQEQGKPDTKQDGISVKQQKGKKGKLQDEEKEEPQSTIAESNEEKLTEKITLYLSWQQLDKLDTMALEYKRRTRRRTDHNKLMRMMIERFTLDDLL